MKTSRFYIFTLIALSLIFGYLTYNVLKPFFTALAWGAVMSIVFYPVYASLGRFIRWKTVNSLITLIVIVLIILGPISYLAVLLAAEAKAVSAYIESGELSSLKVVLEEPRVAAFLDRIRSVLNMEETDMADLIVQNISNVGRQLLGKVSAGVSNAVAAIVNFVFMLLAIFFFLRDGPGFIRRVRNYLPFTEEQKDKFEVQVKDMVVSVIYGGVIVAAIQGLMGGVAFYFLGLSSPVIWGMAIFIMSFIPMLGTFAIWGPVTVYFFIEGAVAKGITLAIVGMLGISMVDNILKPIIIGGRTKMPTLLIFFSVLGGLKLFGPIGIIAGPLVIALFVSIIEIFREVGGVDA